MNRVCFLGEFDYNYRELSWEKANKKYLVTVQEQIEGLVWKGVLDAPTCDKIAAVYDFLMQFRFETQLVWMAENRSKYNCIVLSKMEHLDEVMLNRAFAQIESLQKKIVRDFPGGAEWPGSSIRERP